MKYNDMHQSKTTEPIKFNVPAHLIGSYLDGNRWRVVHKKHEV